MVGLLDCLDVCGGRLCFQAPGSRVISLDDFLRGWFHGSSIDVILRDNVEEFMAYAFLCKPLTQLCAMDRTQVAYFVTRCEEAWTTSFSKGKNKNITFMAHLWEPLRVHHKPLVVHLFSEVAGAANRIWLLMLGFRLQRHKGRVYWTWSPKCCTGAVAGLPIIFLHGVGIGLGPYFFWVLDLLRTYRNHTLILVEYNHISLRLHSSKILFDEAAQDIVQSLILIDAVCLLTCWPGLLQNFIHALPSCQLNGKGCLDVLRYICSRDLMVAEAFCRDFSWSALMLWPEEMPPDTVICLSGADRLVPTDLVLLHLKAAKSSAKIVENRDASHGTFLLPQCSDWRRDIIGGMMQVMAP
ncbi:g8902 [Coccomyxa viridis]|uniref:G8902 protein n=1 Tax=Coccomyxa viridis TaxID=1274662 RepID=A0ABP1G2S4_9CHLO